MIYAEDGMEACYAQFCQAHGFPVSVEIVREGYRRFVYEDGEYFMAHCDVYETNPRPRAYWRGANRAMLEYFGLRRPQAEHLAELVVSELRPNWRLFPDVCPALQSLKAAGLRLGVVSNWGPDLAETLAEVGIRRYFDAIVASEVAGVVKPDPRIFGVALEELGVAPENAVHIGDSHTMDVEGAVNAGVIPVLLDRKQICRDITCTRVNSLSELTVIIHGRQDSNRKGGVAPACQEEA